MENDVNKTVYKTNFAYKDTALVGKYQEDLCTLINIRKIDASIICISIDNFDAVKLAWIRIVNVFKFKEIKFNIGICLNVCF